MEIRLRVINIIVIQTQCRPKNHETPFSLNVEKLCSKLLNINTFVIVYDNKLKPFFIARSVFENTEIIIDKVFIKTLFLDERVLTQTHNSLK